MRSRRKFRVSLTRLCLWLIFSRRASATEPDKPTPSKRTLGGQCTEDPDDSLFSSPCYVPNWLAFREIIQHGQGLDRGLIIMANLECSPHLSFVCRGITGRAHNQPNATSPLLHSSYPGIDSTSHQALSLGNFDRIASYNRQGERDSSTKTCVASPPRSA